MLLEKHLIKTTLLVISVCWPYLKNIYGGSVDSFVRLILQTVSAINSLSPEQFLLICMALSP